MIFMSAVVHATSSLVSNTQTHFNKHNFTTMTIARWCLWKALE